MVPHHNSYASWDQNWSYYCATFLLEGLRNTVLRVCKACDMCQWTAVSTIKYGQVPPKPRPEIVPLHTLCIDLIGPHKVGEDITAMKGQERRTRASWSRKHHLMVSDYDPQLQVGLRLSNQRSFIWRSRKWIRDKLFNWYPLPTEVVHDRVQELREVEKMMKWVTAPEADYYP
jgi:hypothetical protein